MTAAYRDRHPDAPRSWLFNKKFIEQLLNQDGAEYLRSYGSYNGDGEMNQVMVAADADGKDIPGVQMGPGCPCPQDLDCCDFRSPLNGVLDDPREQS